MNLSLGKIIAFAYGSITRRLYLHTAIVAIFFSIVISITIWAGNTLTMITAIARFERTHTVSRVEAMVALLKFRDNKKPAEFESFKAKMAVTQSYNKVFSRLLDMRKDTSDAESVRILESTFSEADHKTAVIIVNRVKVLYWHPILKTLVANAVAANAVGEKMQEQAARFFAADNDAKRAAIFAEIEKSEKNFTSYEASFSKSCSDLSRQISSYIGYITSSLLIISIGFTGLLTSLIARSIIRQAEKYTSDLEREVQARTLTERALNASQLLLNSVVNGTPDAIYVKDLQGRYLLFNSSAERFVGKSAAKVIGKDDTALFPPAEAIAVMESDRAVIEGGAVRCYEEVVTGVTGRVATFLSTKGPLFDSEGKPTGLFGIARDITERKQMELSLQSANKKLQNQYEELQRNDESLRRQNDELQSVQEMLREQINGYEASQKLLYESNRELETTRKILQAAMDCSPAGIAIADAPDGRLRYVNDAGLLIRGGDRESVETGVGIDRYVAGWEIMDLDGSPLRADEAPLTRAIKFGESNSREFIIRRTEGEDRIVMANAAPIRNEAGEIVSGIVVFSDISDRKRAEQNRLSLEQQFQQAQKLESLGVLAGGIAHDFNNILMTIIGNADLALMRINKESPVVENLHRIEQASARAADLAKQMLAYSGKGTFVVENVDLNILLEEMLHMLEVSISKKAVLRFNLHQPLPSVECDATQIRQIVMNLVINASEAIGDKSGVIAITTGCMDCDRNYLKDVWLDENISAGLYVYLEIADSGCGMDKETMAKLFDPFFTTKFTGRGLGMAAVLGIVRSHKGAIKVYSEPNRGTTFKILVPASDRPAELFNGHAHPDDWQGSGKVLLVDDEETVRGIGKEMLQELGFTVITADDGSEGVAAFKQNPDIEFVVLDLTMPHMDGEQCFRELKQLKPDIKVMISSGYSEQEVSIKFVGKGLAGFIQKPYKLSVLREAIRGIS